MPRLGTSRQRTARNGAPAPPGKMGNARDRDRAHRQRRNRDPGRFGLKQREGHLVVPCLLVRPGQPEAQNPQRRPPRHTVPASHCLQGSVSVRPACRIPKIRDLSEVGLLSYRQRPDPRFLPFAAVTKVGQIAKNCPRDPHKRQGRASAKSGPAGRVRLSWNLSWLLSRDARCPNRIARPVQQAAASEGRLGSVKQAWTPSPISLVTAIRPPCASTIARATGRPSPVPPS